MRGRGHDWISASEIGDFVYCSHAWWLKRNGVRPTANASARDAGSAYHRAHGAGVRRLGGLDRAGRLLTKAAVLALALLLLYRLVAG